MSQTNQRVGYEHVVEHPTTFLNGVDDRGEIVVSQNNVGSVFGNIRAGLTHGDTDVGTLERWRIVDTVTSL